MIRRPPRSTRTDTLFPDTTRFRADEIAAAIITDMPAWVRFWGTFKDDFLGFPEPNKLVGPNGREGGWGYLAGGRFRLGEREAVILTLAPAGSYYTGFQISDPWTISPDKLGRASWRERVCPYV